MGFGGWSDNGSDEVGFETRFETRFLGVDGLALKAESRGKREWISPTQRHLGWEWVRRGWWTD